jgi:hypothetical protein
MNGLLEYLGKEKFDMERAPRKKTQKMEINNAAIPGSMPTRGVNQE